MEALGWSSLGGDELARGLHRQVVGLEGKVEEEGAIAVRLDHLETLAELLGLEVARPLLVS